jgi:hypothetical protein
MNVTRAARLFAAHLAASGAGRLAKQPSGELAEVAIHALICRAPRLLREQRG